MQELTEDLKNDKKDGGHSLDKMGQMEYDRHDKKDGGHSLDKMGQMEYDRQHIRHQR